MILRHTVTFQQTSWAGKHLHASIKPQTAICVERCPSPCTGDEEGLEDGDVESGSDAELAAVLEHASGLVGRKAGPGGAGKKRRRQAAGVLDGRCGGERSFRSVTAT